MAGIPILFADTMAAAVSERDRRRIDAALRRIAIGEPPGQWRDRPDAILVMAALTDGRSGALVLRVEVWRGTQHLSHIAKVSSLASARAEWEAYTSLLEQAPSVLCPPIEAVTEGVLDPRFAPPGEDEAVVYTDVERFAGAATASLEDLVAAAAQGQPGAVDQAAEVISRLFELADGIFYNRYQTAATPGERLDANLSLGPDLRLDAEHAEADGRSTAAGPGPAPGGPGRRLSPADVLAAGLYLPGADDSSDPGDELPTGSAVALSGLEPRRAGDPILAARDYVSVEIGPGAWRAGLEPRFSVYGTVAGTRSALTWERIRHALPGLKAISAGTMQVGQTRTAHPFSALRGVLTKPVTGLVTAVAHGDLNPRNVLIARYQPFLIDYARARPGQPILGDFTWLEINLVRGPLAGLSFAGLVEAERLLALGDRVADLLPGDQHDQVYRLLADLAAEDRPELTAPIKILGTIRRRARQSYARAGSSAPPWWREYAAQLLLAAHRTFKWSGDQQPEADLRAAVAAAAVASEQLAWPDDPWRLWDPARLAAATAAVLPRLPGEPAILPLLASLVSGLDSLGAGGDLEQEVQRALARVAGSALALTAERMGELRDRHDRYIDLPASVPGAERIAENASAVTRAASEAQSVVLGASGTGKTALLDELEYRLAHGAPGRFPVRVRAADLAGAGVGDHGPDLLPLATRIPVTAGGLIPPAALLAVGGVHLLVDDFDRVPAAGRAGVAAWLRGLRKRFPRSRVTICHRGQEVPGMLTGVPAEQEPGWTGLLLGEPSDEQVVGYLTRFHVIDHRLSAARAAELIAAVQGETDGRGLRELARTPLLLWLLASGGQDLTAPFTEGDLADAYIRGLESGGPDSPRWRPAAEALAEWQTASAEEATRDERFLAVLSDTGADPDVAAHWDGLRDQLADLGILVADGPVTRFRLKIYRDYFAARRLAAIGRDDPDQLSALALRFGWRDAFSLFASFSSTGPDVLEGPVEAVADADPGYAARLLRSPARPPAGLTSRFLARQEQILRHARAGRVARARAAHALAEVGSPDAFRRLLAVLSDPGTDPAAAELTLIELASAQLTAGPGSRRRRVARELTARLDALLARAEPPLLTLILRTVGDLELRGLELLVAGHLGRPGPWPVVQEAWTALRKLGVILPADLAETYLRARRDRLAEVERELPRATSSAEANQLQRERFLLLDAHRGAEMLPRWLERRFAFEIGAALAELIDAALPAEIGPAEIGPAEIGPAGDDRWRVILGHPAPAPDDLLAAVTGPDALAAAAAAHRLLRDRPDLAGRLFLALTAGGRTDRALIAAAAAAVAPPPGLADYFGRVLAACLDDGTSLEGAAALAQVIYARDQQAGLRLVREAHRSLADRRRADRLRWPWSSALARFGGTPAQLDTMLSADPGPSADPELSADSGNGHELALEALASSGFLITGGRAAAHRFGDAARQRLLSACRDATAGEIVMLLRAAAAMSVPEALDVLFPGGAGRSLADAVAGLDPRSAATVAVAGLGLVEVAPAADALAALGYLGRLGSQASGVAAAVPQLLRDFDPSAGHPSVATGRLTGLGFLGDWPPVLAALGLADPRLPVVARHVIELWLPGPRTPAGHAGPASVAGWIAERLAGQDLDPDTRSVLLELKRSAEERAGALTPAPGIRTA